MLSKNIDFQEERRHAQGRLILVLVFTILGFVIFNRLDKDIASVIFTANLVLGALSIFSLLHYIFIMRKPFTLIAFRKHILIFFDLLSVTFLTGIFEENGLFLLPLYIIIVMRSGLSFGIGYFYISIVSASFSWILLLFYFPYWQEHTDILATFAMTTFLIPLFYLKFITRIHEDNYKLSEKLEVTQHDANYDSLTGAPNRKMYKEVMKEAINENEFFTLLFIDLNKFKAINDNYGHHIGDSVLKEVSKRLSDSIDDEDFFARLGGDEFVIITKRRKAFLKKFIEKLEYTTIGKHTAEGVTVPIELSIGISMYPDDSKEEMMLSKYADEAMYEAKQNPNSYHAYYSEI